MVARVVPAPGTVVPVTGTVVCATVVTGTVEAVESVVLVALVEDVPVVLVDVVVVVAVVEVTVVVVTTVVVVAPGAGQLLMTLQARHKMVKNKNPKSNHQELTSGAVTCTHPVPTVTLVGFSVMEQSEADANVMIVSTPDVASQTGRV